MPRTVALAALGLLLLAASIAPAEEESRYVPETDTLVLQQLDKWQDLKFGLLMHWGTYSQWGIVESWSLCPEDYGWCERREGSDPGDYFTYKQEYENLQTTFDPGKFDPRPWAEAARRAGMGYVVFTTKHHDGFCMFDTELTDYKITSDQCPHHDHPRADVTRAIFDAFRAEGLWAGAYFSKPDWHSPDYWAPYWPPLDRNVNYDPDLYPERWDRFVEFTHGQIMELMENYGDVDILWLDGGWVAKKDADDIRGWYARKLEETDSGFLKKRIVNQDIHMDALVKKARAAQPGLIVVDRAVPGIHQNYLTPENRVPEEPLPFPWESCIIAGGSWSWVPDAQYMSGREAVHLLVDIVAKGGNLLLNIAPGPDGTWHDEAYRMLADMGAWMDVNAEAIQGTRAIAPYKSGAVCFTRQKDGPAVYAIHLAEEGQEEPPARLTVDGIQPAAGATVRLLGHDAVLEWTLQGDGFSVAVPAAVQDSPPCHEAWALKISAIADPPPSDFQRLVTMMTGSFSSQAQAEADTNFFDIRLEMKPIWQDRATPDREAWFYVEQAAAWTLDKPYRQRVYHVTDEGDGVYRSMVYSLPDPEAAIGAWRLDRALDDIGPADLSEREGCAVYLRKLPDGSFRGATRARECTSSLRGATYATSEITILPDRIVSWDRGWDDGDEQVWGAEISGYVFLRAEKP